MTEAPRALSLAVAPATVSPQQPLPEGSQAPGPAWDRSLANQGFMFLCSKDTVQECMEHMLFGAPMRMWGVLQKLVPKPGSVR